ncbi:MAG TPA: hypothetical protein VNJ12_12340 [Candidatus Dormibacteraeota bacterium]|nr:hypothetical protein [Candidatus Dormibacteraeota bacterium]
MAPAPPGGPESARIARLVREAAQGNPHPARTLPAGRDREEDDILRDFLALLFDINRKVNEQSKETDKEALAALYTARSFLSPETMGRATRAVRELFQINRRVAAEMRIALDGVKGRIEGAQWSEGEKTLFWREFRQGFAAQFRLRSELFETQEMWARATSEVYEFALCHSDELRFEGKTVRASSREVGRQFVGKLKHAKHCREEFRAAAARLHEEQVTLMIQRGVAAPPAS